MNRVSYTCVTSRIAAAPIRFLNVILTSLFYVIPIYTRCARKQRMAGGAEKRVALAGKEVTRKLGYEDVKACQLEVIAGL